MAPLLKQNDVLSLEGDLGVGKTYMTRGIIEGLGGDPAQVSSPTFTFVHEYITPKFQVNHCDFYRLTQGNELEDFGGLEFFNLGKITIVEWLERFAHVREIPPKRLLIVHLQLDAEGRIALLPVSLKISREFRN